MSGNWNAEGRWRSDGLTVTPNVGNGWIILPGDDRPAVDTCPCCDVPLFSIENARALADSLYPIVGGA